MYIRGDGNKLAPRDRYLVVNIDNSYCYLRKFVGSQLRSSPYRVKLQDCFRVPPDLDLAKHVTMASDSSDDEEFGDDHIPQPQPPAVAVPQEIINPPDMAVNEEIPDPPNLGRPRRNIRTPAFLQENYVLT